jgi:WD40 repeat protein
VVCRWPDRPADPVHPAAEVTAVNGADRTEAGGPHAALLPAGPAAAALSALAVSPCGQLVARAVLADADWLLLDELATGEPRRHYALPPGGRLGPRRLHLAFSGDGTRLAVAAADGRSVVLDTRTGAVLGEFSEPGPTLRGVALDATGALVAHATGDGRGRLVVRRVADATGLLEAGPKELRQLTGLAFAPDGSELVAAGATYGRDAAVWTIPLSGGDLAPVPRIAVHDLPMGDQPHGSLVWAATGPRACFPGSRGASVVWDADGRILADIPFGAGEGAIALSPDGSTLVTVTQSGARRWSL